MIYDPSRHHRRSIRLKGYDYRKAGAYFVTIDVRNWMKLFGRIKSGVMHLNGAGLMAQRIWTEIPDYYRGVLIDEFVVMPDHFHGIVCCGMSRLKMKSREMKIYDGGKHGDLPVRKTNYPGDKEMKISLKNMISCRCRRLCRDLNR